jgi:hypothetical protein
VPHERSRFRRGDDEIFELFESLANLYGYDVASGRNYTGSHRTDGGYGGREGARSGYGMKVWMMSGYEKMLVSRGWQGQVMW